MLVQEYQALQGKLPGNWEKYKKACDDEFERRMKEAKDDDEDTKKRIKRARERSMLRAFHTAVHEDTPRLALCLSGGGIRSATFNLGVLQALARGGLLKSFDYLSTVSGGGYVGSWLSAWIHREHGGREGVFKDLAASVEKLDKSAPGMMKDGAGAGGQGAGAGEAEKKQKQGKEECAAEKGAEKYRTFWSGREAEPTEIRHLREYSNYLTPRLGLLRPDTATLIATYLRNLLLNWMVLCPLIIGVVLVPRLYLGALYANKITAAEHILLIRTTAQVLMMIAIAAPLLMMPVSRAGRESHSNDEDKRSADPDVPEVKTVGPRTRSVLAFVITPLVLNALILSLLAAWLGKEPDFPAWQFLGLTWKQFRWVSWMSVYMLPPVVVFGVNWCRREGGTKLDWRCFLALTLVGLFIGTFWSWVVWKIPWIARFGEYPIEYACLKVPFSCAVYFIMATLYVGLTSGRAGGDEDREWWGRLMGWVLLVGVGWMILFGIGLLGPRMPWLRTIGRVDGSEGAKIDWTRIGWASLLGTAVSILPTLVAVFSGHSESTSAQEGATSGPMKRVINAIPSVAAHVGVPMLFILASWLANLVLAHRDGIDLGLYDGKLGKYLVLVHSLAPQSKEAMDLGRHVVVFGSLGIAAAMLIVWVIDRSTNFNRFSLHAIYRDRLIRAFLGASNLERKADGFTGLDPEDNLPMHHLRRCRKFAVSDLGNGKPDAIEVVARELSKVRPGFFARLQELDGMGAGAIATTLAEYESAKKIGNESDVLERLTRTVLDYVNRIVLDGLLSEPYLKEAQDKWAKGKAGHKDKAIDLALRALRYDRFPALVNRLIMEAEAVAAPSDLVETKYFDIVKDSDGRGKNTGDLRLLVPMGGVAPPKPLHVVNMALNLVETRNLAWQQRKAASFTATPLHCGFYKGYREAVEYGGPISLGTAMTISGAAASPNMGYHSSPAVTFLMTLFNVRLGWWLGNPGTIKRHWLSSFLSWMGLGWLPQRDPLRNVFRRGDPRQSALPLINEALGRTNDEYPYVYLSDGGHFDNLGIYEMVRRRCRFILVSDATRDPKCSFDDLGNAIRKVQNDFGIPIVMREALFYPDQQKIAENHYCAIAEIHYKEVDTEGENGVLVYIKPALHQFESIDVYNHGRKNSSFPHEPTSNQWFSESQFESYRKLGCEMVAYLFTKDDLKLGAAGERSRFAKRVDDAIKAILVKVDGDVDPLERFLTNAQEEAKRPSSTGRWMERANELISGHKLGVAGPTDRQQGRKEGGRVGDGEDKQGEPGSLSDGQLQQPQERGEEAAASKHDAGGVGAQDDEEGEDHRD